MVVDDDMDLVEFVGAVFQNWDPNTVLVNAYDARSAWSKILEFKPDLLVLDLKLPGIYGYQLCAKLRRQEETKNAKVLVATSYDTENVRKMVKEAGADGFLAKPFTKEQLLAAVNDLLKRT